MLSLIFHPSNVNGSVTSSMAWTSDVEDASNPPGSVINVVVVTVVPFLIVNEEPKSNSRESAVVLRLSWVLNKHGVFTEQITAGTPAPESNRAVVAVPESVRKMVEVPSVRVAPAAAEKTDVVISEPEVVTVPLDDTVKLPDWVFCAPKLKVAGALTPS